MTVTLRPLSPKRVMAFASGDSNVNSVHTVLEPLRLDSIQRMVLVLNGIVDEFEGQIRRSGYRADCPRDGLA